MNANNISISNSNFNPVTPEDIIKTLSLTIKKDNYNKLATFLCCLSAYTDDSQINISFNAPSSTGKSYIALEISKYFPEIDLIKLGSSSPTAFFHEEGILDKENKIITIDLSSKIVIFIDQPNSYLLERLRPLLSHDLKEIIYKITDKKERGGLATKTVKLIGYPSVIFCSASLNLDEQENTRFLLLSPEISDEKILEAIHSKINKESNPAGYRNWLNEDKDRNKLIKRIQAIKEAKIKEIIITNPDQIEKKFLSARPKLQPRHQRDIERFISLIKIFALLNFWHREKYNNTIFANNDDINYAFELWNKISFYQELGIPPYIHDLLEEIIIPCYLEKNKKFPETDFGISRQEIMLKHYQIYKRSISEYKLRAEILPMLANSGLITQKSDPIDKRKLLVHPNIKQ